MTNGQPTDLAEQARHLMLIVRELRELGFDMPLVRLDDDGVTEMSMTLSDELALIALAIDWDAAMEITNGGHR